MACRACGSDEQVRFPAELDLKIYVDPTRSAMPIQVLRQELSICVNCGVIEPFFSDAELTLLRQFGGSSSIFL
jgi:hypothetical protein